jgi:hypothetical protein
MKTIVSFVRLALLILFRTESLKSRMQTKFFQRIHEFHSKMQE